MPPAQPQPTPPDPVFSEVRAGGLPIELPLLGVSQVGPIELAAERSTLEIGVTATSIESGEQLRYQYRIDGLESEFGAASEHTTRLYPSLSPGTYRVEVRTVDRSGTTSRATASLDLRVLAPWWQRGWFVAGFTSMLAAIGYLFHRQRLRRGVMLERMRLRIATDLHDDLGSSLSSIAIQSDVMSRTAVGLSDQERARLQRVAASAAEMVETMSDIVWAVNPRFDRLSQLAHRMHRFARETLGTQGVAIQFVHHHPERDIELDSAARRQLYLIFKELIHNIAKHAQAKRVEITIELTNDRIQLGVSDDGCGFERAAVGGRGLGLESLARRAASIGAELQLESTPGRGTSAQLLLRRLK
jgi:signal transduction histidine kinase